MSPFGFTGSGERYAAAGQAFGLAPARESMLFGRDRFDLRDRSEGMDTSRNIPHVLVGVSDGVPTEVFELDIRTRSSRSSNSNAPEWREERWLVAMIDLSERFPKLSIQPRGFMGKLFKGIAKGIETGDAAFDRAYHVSSGDRESTLGILRPGLVAWLAAQRPADVRFELSGSCALVARQSWGPDEVGTLLQILRAFRANLFAPSAQAQHAFVPAGTPASAPAAPQSAAPARFCANCGTPVIAGARFCGSCGALLAAVVG